MAPVERREDDADSVFRDAIALANCNLAKDDFESAITCSQLLMCCLQLHGIRIQYEPDHVQTGILKDDAAVVDLTNPDLLVGSQKSWRVRRLLKTKLLDEWYAFDLVVRLAIELYLLDATASARAAHFLAKEAVGICQDIPLATLQNFIQWSIYFATICSESDPEESMHQTDIDWYCQVWLRHPEASDNVSYFDEVLLPLYTLAEEAEVKDANPPPRATIRLISNSDDTEQEDESQTRHSRFHEYGMDDYGQTEAEKYPALSETLRLLPSTSRSNENPYLMDEVRPNDKDESESGARGNKMSRAIRRRSSSIRRSFSLKRKHRPEVDDEETSISRKDDNSGTKTDNRKKLRRASSSVPAKSDQHQRKTLDQPLQAPLGYWEPETEIIRVAHSFQLYKRHKRMPSAPASLPSPIYQQSNQSDDSISSIESTISLTVEEPPPKKRSNWKLPFFRKKHLSPYRS
ncbi:hypothetical protein GGR57DRAFT_195244 [Xylariaceae sp. FL1272]|nr:hypothetical protein GGR57DRAFT_195244 [Xylariaceae sp. FL1272]